MKTSAYLAALVASMLLSGCVVQSTYSKTVTVTKDPSGKILNIVETETVVQPAQGYPLKLKLIDGVQP
ncbi:hypothetical protein LGR51_03960 [Pseudomonas sp. NP21570]|uniref:hypothetical protein n=1 Tax=Stutzerimonas TaxID=2901164 RepID=UPI0008B5E572|nr:hypothetical protein [Stutzerimonas kunmingensis]MBU2331649.1 hypothetical protein [Gammaproteobacteria bacterium]MCB4793660.1 hypothetical protein [Pseudomonas sp. NP21570]OHC15393.1 MAG: hypothetical protein A2180_00345 [Pseudomonadales bacterium GWC2_63_15]|tara:strand:- start:9844 stop:10047 length:204 start_codon:yes stop_codon:yes gene_type:complete